MDYVALIIDDNANNLDALATMLQREGVTAITLESPRDCPAALREITHVDVVFLDLVFPNYNGIELIGILKADKRLYDVPFVAYTVHIGERNEAREAGFHSFLGKPLNVDRFSERLQRILAGDPVWETDC